MDTRSSSFKNLRIDYKELLKPYLRHWKWFAFCAIVSLVLGYLYIRYSTPEYSVQGKIQILEDQNSPTELNAFRDLEMFAAGNTKVEDEIEILNSRSNMIEVVQQLGLNVKILSKGKLHNTELYQNPPFRLNFLVPDSVVAQSQAAYSVDIKSETTFYFTETEESAPKLYSFGATISTVMGDFVITPDHPNMASLVGNEYIVQINPVSLVAQNYKQKTLVSLTSEMSNIVTITLEDPVVPKAIDIINNLVDIYNQNEIDNKKAVADRTSEFINDRIADIYGDLASVDQSAQEFKTDRGITDVASQSDLNYTVSSQSQQDLENANIQLNIASSMKSIVEGQDGYEILPANVGLQDGSISNTTSRYNELVLERNRLLKSSNEKNPIIVNLDQQLNGLKKSLQSSLNSVTNNLNMQVNNLSSQLSKVNARLYAAPKNERALRDITRQQQTTESLYLYLLQKREESQITYAQASPKSKVIDRAYMASQYPVSPKKNIILLASLIVGMFLPFSVIYGRQLLDNKIHNKVELEKMVGDIPVLAELPKLNKHENILVKSGERTVLAESLRILRTNLDYLIRSKSYGHRNNLIFVTSSIPGEGKTVLSSNLAMIFANTGKRVLLIGADIRNPKIYKFYSGKNVDKLSGGKHRREDIGLTEYLVDKSLDVQDIITPVLAYQQEVDVIYSGRIPPNPAELLMSGRMKELLNEVSEIYDYVIVDTAPLMVVSDTLLISQYANHIIYVTRAGFTETKVLHFPLKLKEEGKLPGLAFVVNGVKESDLGYGGKYGYGYDKPLKRWWKIA